LRASRIQVIKAEPASPAGSSFLAGSPQFLIKINAQSTTVG
jgi:hypothetical protein